MVTVAIGAAVMSALAVMFAAILDDVLDGDGIVAVDSPREDTMKRQVSYQWRLREVMAAHGMFTISDLVPLPADRDIKLSAALDP